MLNHEIQIPSFLHEIHGEAARLTNLLLVYTIGIGAAGFAIAILAEAQLAWWQYAILGVVFFDIAGGVVANLSTPTNRYYASRPMRSIVFALLHVLQPAAFAIVFPEAWPYWLYIVAVTVPATFVIRAIPDTEHQQNLGAFIVVAATLVATLFPLEHAVLYSIAPLFFIKLLLGFAVQRPALYEHENGNNPITGSTR